ncbi:MAG: helix-turn-helix transcriptional regulator [Fusobacterium sp.]|nr:helix-turn-helix transcriptional regulator [Fusobacterium sp.]
MLEDLLSPSQLSVLKYVAVGYSNKQIAAKLFVSEATVKAHVKEIISRLNVTNRLQAAIIAANFLGITKEEIYKAVDDIRREKDKT